MTDLDYVGSGEVARIVGLSPSAVSNLRKRGKIPLALGEIGGHPFWDRTTIEKWADERYGPVCSCCGHRPGVQPRPL